MWKNQLFFNFFGCSLRRFRHCPVPPFDGKHWKQIQKMKFCGGSLGRLRCRPVVLNFYPIFVVCVAIPSTVLLRIRIGVSRSRRVVWIGQFSMHYLARSSTLQPTFSRRLSKLRSNRAMPPQLRRRVASARVIAAKKLASNAYQKKKTKRLA